MTNFCEHCEQLYLTCTVLHQKNVSDIDVLDKACMCISFVTCLQCTQSFIAELKGSDVCVTLCRYVKRWRFEELGHV